MKKEIDIKEYFALENKIDSLTKKEEFIDIHRYLIDKTCDCDYLDIKDCGFQFIRALLNRDSGITYVYEYKDGAKEFIESKYLSDYFKSYFDFDSNKDISDMNKIEIKPLYDSLNDEDKQVFKAYLYKLNSDNINDFIKKNIDSKTLASDILSSSGLSSLASTYVGRGVNYGDLNDFNLNAIFNKLFAIDKNYAFNYVDMVLNMETLGATEFINAFKSLASNGFIYDEEHINSSKVSLDGLYGDLRDKVATSVLHYFLDQDYDYQKFATEQMKLQFILKNKEVCEFVDKKDEKVRVLK